MKNGVWKRECFDGLPAGSLFPFKIALFSRIPTVFFPICSLFNESAYYFLFPGSPKPMVKPLFSKYESLWCLLEDSDERRELLSGNMQLPY